MPRAGTGFVLSAQFDRAAIFEPDVIVPAQFHASTTVVEPIRALVNAVLERAIWDLGETTRILERIRKRPHPTSLYERRRLAAIEQLMLETVAWFRSDDRSWPYSFLNLCDYLGLDAPAIREGILRANLATLMQTKRQRTDGNGIRPERPHPSRPTALRIKALRARRQDTQRTVGRWFGVSSAAVSAWERGVSAMSPEQLRRLDELERDHGGC